MTVESLEADITSWRAFIEERSRVGERDVDELEDHLRNQIDDLVEAGLSGDEAFVVAIKRIGALDEIAREFAQEHSGGVWRQLVVGERDRESVAGPTRMLGFALAAALAFAVAVQIAIAAGDEEPWWLIRSATLIVAPFLAGFFANRRQIALRKLVPVAATLGVLAIVVNLYPYVPGGFTELLVATHLPVLVWFIIAIPYMGGDLGSHERRMNFIRFSGEWFIYYVLIALGGGVLTALTGLILEPAGLDVESIILWVVPAGAAAAVIVAAWLVESKQSVIENMAPVLTIVFTPLFAVMLTAAATVYLLTGQGGEFDRELLGIFDALLVVVSGLVLYRVSARDTTEPPGWMDRIQLVAVTAALVLDVSVLGSMIARIGELGFTPNRTAALGLNVLLLISLLGTAWLSVRFLRGKATFHRLERWQTAYLPVFAVWALVVVVVLPPLFSFE